MKYQTVNISILFILTLLGIRCQFQKTSQEYVHLDLTNEIVVPETYIVSRTIDEIRIDGRDLEKAWSNAPQTKPFIDIEGKKKVPFSTFVKMLWDDNYLYVFAFLEEPHIWGDIIKRDAVIFHNNDFEVFISPSKTTAPYAEIEINALNTVWDLLLTKPYRDGGKAINEWNLDGLITKVHIEGTLNNSKDIDQYWSVEMAIPLKPLTALKKRHNRLPEPGEQWRVNFSRVNWDFSRSNDQYARAKDSLGKLLPEYNWVWSNQNVINMHEPEKWGTIQFGPEPDSSSEKFTPEANRIEEQAIYAIYRKVKRGDLLDKDLNPGQLLKLSIQVQSESFNGNIQKSPSGFEIILNTKEGSQLILDESGNLTSK